MPSGAGPTIDTKAVAAEVPLSQSVGWKLAMAAMMAGAYAGVAAIAPFFPAAADMVVTHLPTIFIAAAPLIKGGAAAFAAWLISRAKTQHDQSVVTALRKAPPDDMSQFYK